MSRNTAPRPENLTPVIVGIGEVSEHGAAPQAGREPLELMAAALRAAALDCGAPDALSNLDSLDVVMPMSWRYEDLAGQLSARIGASPARAVLGPSGGESPVRYIHYAARAIAAGECTWAAIAGGEAKATLGALQRAGMTPDWTPFAKSGPNFADVGDAIDPVAMNHGLFLPLHVYGLYEAASSHAAGLKPGQSHALSADIMARYSRVAAGNPHSRLREPMSAQQIATPSPNNRMTGGPYTKSMVAQMNVNQSAAIIITSLAAAKAVGIAADKCVHISAGAYANAPRNFMRRARYDSSPEQAAVLNRMKSFGDLGALELYSCFPVVPKMAAATLGLPDDYIPTVAGGLPFFGAPLNNYMTHAACAMVREIRGGSPCGTLYGQGEYVTKHHALRLSNTAEDFDIFGGDVNAAPAPAPPLTASPEGAAKIVTYTAFWNRDNTPEKVVAMVEMQTEERALITVPSRAAGFDAFMSGDAYPIGHRGAVGDKGTWRFT